jgi:hypothetical protein
MISPFLVEMTSTFLLLTIYPNADGERVKGHNRRKSDSRHIGRIHKLSSDDRALIYSSFQDDHLWLDFL